MTSNNAFAARTSIVGVVATNEYNMASDMCSDVAGPSSSGSGDLFELSDSSGSRTFTISPRPALPGAILYLSVTTATLLLFGACCVIMHKVYSIRRHFAF